MGTYDIIKNLAKNNNISISELERKLDLSNGSISKWNKNKPNTKYLEKIADYFEVSIDYLLGRSDLSHKDPVSFYRINTNGLNDNEVNEIKSELDEYTEFLKSRLHSRQKKED